MSFSAGIRFPFIYGTAWKKDRTAALVSQAISAGFRAIDTAAQPKHYREDFVGDAIRNAFRSGIVRREELYIQTKYTSVGGQDPSNMPYDATETITNQVYTSLSSSLYHLRPSMDNSSVNDSFIDCLILHSPLPSISLTLEAWRAMSAFVPSKVRTLGISNTTLSTLKEIIEHCDVKPVAVQNRFYAATKYDIELREFCQEHDITYQSFWTLTGNPQLLKSSVVVEVAKELNIDSAQALYALVSGLGVIPLNGTTNESRMKEDLDAIHIVDLWKRHDGNLETWNSWMAKFEGVLRS